MSELITLTLVLVGIILFVIGILIGWLFANQAELTVQNRLKTMVALVVSLGWITATIAGIIVGTYTVSPLLHALMGAIVGYFFTEDGVNLNVGGDK